MSIEVYQSSKFAEVYGQLVRDCLYLPHEHPTSRGEKMLEMRNVVLEFPADTIPIIKNDARSASEAYLAGEFIWYYSGSDSLEFIQTYSQFWKDIANDDGTCNSSYGKLLFRPTKPHNQSQYGYAYKCLISDMETRRAYMHFARPQFQELHSKDIICTLTGNFHIRGDLLHLTIHMRSSDLYYGLIYDVPFFVSLCQQMWRHLQPIYKHLLLGNVTMFLDSVHMYRRNLSVFKNMAKHAFKQDEMPMVHEHLINQQGAPTQNTMRLYNDARVYTIDELMVWLQNTSVTNTKESSW